MKTQLKLVLSLSLFGLLLADSTVVTIKYPSDLHADGERGTTPYGLDFVLRPMSDFRLMYCDVSTLSNRISRGVCVLDFDAPRENHLEVPANGSTLGEVLKQSGEKQLQNWKGNDQPTICIISKRAIMSDEGSAQFLATKVSPGDFIVVGSIY